VTDNKHIVACCGAAAVLNFTRDMLIENIHALQLAAVGSQSGRECHGCAVKIN